MFGNYVLIGEWGHSWLLASEILAVAPPKVVRTVYARPRARADTTWDVDDPQQWMWASECWWHSTPPDRIIHGESGVAAEWDYDFAEEFSEFTDEVRRLKDNYGEVRFVFGFA